MKRCAMCDHEYADDYDGCPECAGALSQARIGARRWRSYALFLVIVAPVAIFASVLMPPVYGYLWTVFCYSAASAALLVLLLSPLVVLLTPVRILAPVSVKPEATFDDPKADEPFQD